MLVKNYIDTLCEKNGQTESPQGALAQLVGQPAEDEDVQMMDQETDKLLVHNDADEIGD